MAKAPKLDIAIKDVVALAMFAQRSPNAEFREGAFALALVALDGRQPSLPELRPLCEFAARTKAKTAGAELARGVALRLLRESGRAELRSQLAQSIKAR